MIQYQRHVLDNGLTVILHHDSSTPMAILNLMYNVGTRNEVSSKTGFAHLFEHLMFGGTKDVPDFDYEIELAAGENNAFTSTDATTYYDILPANNIETAIWLEANRMQHLNINQKALDIQKKVVIEEFYETCLNLPYGEAWHHIVKMAYGDHPYSWPTIGLTPDHIKNANLSDVKSFFDIHYQPSNAILVIAGNLDNNILSLVKKWFEPIPSKTINRHPIAKAKIRSSLRSKTITKPLPTEMLYMSYGMCNRFHKDFYAIDLLSDILCNGKSSRLYQNLVKENSIFSQIDAYITGATGEGLFVIEGQLMTGISLDEAQSLVEKELKRLQDTIVESLELQKVKNKIESNMVFSDLSISNKAHNLAYYESLGDVSLINRERELYSSVTMVEIQSVAKQLFEKDNTIILKYKTVGE